MSTWIHAEASYVIDARPEEIHAIVADFRVDHPAILPRQYFTSLVVEQGGQGAGTIVLGAVKVLGKEYTFRQRISEPEPGRVLDETDVDTGQLTRWTFEPLDGGAQTRVTIASDYPPSPGFVGWLERLAKPAVARDMYRKELRQLADYVRSKRAAAPAD
jgi:Polyketide cyclase / dehydrase and lipid transport